MVKHISYEPDLRPTGGTLRCLRRDGTHQPASANCRRRSKLRRGAAPAGGANLFDHVIYDSHIERNFAGLLENDSEHVRLFTKLPRRFRVRTPVGEYSPDWAIVYDEDGNSARLPRPRNQGHVEP